MQCLVSQEMVKKGMVSGVRYRNTYEGTDQCCTGKAENFRPGNRNQDPVISGNERAEGQQTGNVPDCSELCGCVY